MLSQDSTNPAPVKTAYERYMAQDAEWKEICNELITAGEGKTVTAYQVTLEQRKRMLARGERAMTYPEILEAIATETTSRTHRD
jgi:uncharacterized protein YbcV (DUF1398 family)